MDAIAIKIGDHRNRPNIRRAIAARSLAKNQAIASAYDGASNDHFDVSVPIQIGDRRSPPTHRKRDDLAVGVVAHPLEFARVVEGQETTIPHTMPCIARGDDIRFAVVVDIADRDRAQTVDAVGWIADGKDLLAVVATYRTNYAFFSVRTAADVAGKDHRGHIFFVDLSVVVGVLERHDDRRHHHVCKGRKDRASRPLPKRRGGKLADGWAIGALCVGGDLWKASFEFEVAVISRCAVGLLLASRALVGASPLVAELLVCTTRSPALLGDEALCGGRAWEKPQAPHHTDREAKGGGVGAVE